jgi:heme exporter protein C
MFQRLLSCISPKYFYQHVTKVYSFLGVISLLLILAGLTDGLYFAPADYQQGDAFRIIYIHVPASFMSLTIYGFMSLCALSILIWKIKLAEVLLKVSVAIGLGMTFIALTTGSLWGKPMWGTAWIWDARLTSELVLFFLYFAILALFNAIRDAATAARVTAIIVLIGAIDIPIVHYSVNWWHTLHQGATLSGFQKPTMDSAMLYPLLMMIIGFFTYTFSLILYRAKTEILYREKNAQWIKELFS